MGRNKKIHQEILIVAQTLTLLKFTLSNLFTISIAYNYLGKLTQFTSITEKKNLRLTEIDAFFKINRLAS